MNVSRDSFESNACHYSEPRALVPIQNIHTHSTRTRKLNKTTFNVAMGLLCCPIFFPFQPESVNADLYRLHSAEDVSINVQ